jgi:hypothetical protein
MKVKKTSRGFEFVEFKDSYGEKCSLQESSNVIPHVWLGCEENGKFHMGDYLSPRMHLDQKQVRELVKFLTNWLKTGSFKK